MKRWERIEIDRRGRTNAQRFPYRRNKEGKHLCRVCKSVLSGRKTSFCNKKCLNEFFLKTDWRLVRKVIYKRDGGVCQECFERVRFHNFHVDHIVPISKGGDEWDQNNLRLTCAPCNLRKGSSIYDDDLAFYQCITNLLTRNMGNHFASIDGDSNAG